MGIFGTLDNIHKKRQRTYATSQSWSPPLLVPKLTPGAGSPTNDAGPAPALVILTDRNVVWVAHARISCRPPRLVGESRRQRHFLLLGYKQPDALCI